MLDTERTAGEGAGRMPWILVIALAFIIVGGTVDLVLDQPESWLSAHVVFETLMIAGALLVVTTLWIGWWRAERAAVELRASLEESSEDRDRWRSSAEHALRGLGRAMREQFDAWELTPAERDVALMLLKGHSHKGIAKLTDRSAQTVRQHAVAVYGKAGLRSRAELSAFFLADLMLPEQESDG